MIHEDEAVFDIIFDSGGCRAMSVGYCVILKTGKTIEVRVLRRAGYRKHVLPSTPIRQWHYWLVTHTSNDISVYINGCNTVPFAIESDSPRVAAHTEDADFHIGDWSGGGLAPHMTIDELMIWYKVLTVDQIWQLYVQGGMVWNTMTSLDGSIFHVTALYWRGDPTVTGGSHNITKANEMDLWWFHWFAPEKKNSWAIIERPIIWDATVIQHRALCNIAVFKDYKMGKKIHSQILWDVITHPCPNVNGGLANLPLKLGHGWLNSSHFFYKDTSTYPCPFYVL